MTKKISAWSSETMLALKSKSVLRQYAHDKRRDFLKLFDGPF